MAFQFTLPRGERPAPLTGEVATRCFNSRSRGGSDPGRAWTLSASLVSIHAPAGGATARRYTSKSE